MAYLCADRVPRWAGKIQAVMQHRTEDLLSIAAIEGRPPTQQDVHDYTTAPATNKQKCDANSSRHIGQSALQCDHGLSREEHASSNI